MHKWMVVLLAIATAGPAFGQERTCTREEIIERQSELPALMPLDPEAASKVFLRVLGCKGIAQPRLLARSQPDQAVVTSAPPPNTAVLTALTDRVNVTFLSEPDDAEIWYQQEMAGITAVGFTALSSDIRTVVLKKSGFRDCTRAQWIEQPAEDGAMTITCKLTPLGKSRRIAFYSGVDLYGADLAMMHANGGEQCLQACLANGQCRAMTFNTNPNIKTGPNCFLKTEGWQSTLFEQAISAILLTSSDREALAVGSRTVMPTDIRTQD